MTLVVLVLGRRRRRRSIRLRTTLEPRYSGIMQRLPIAAILAVALTSCVRSNVQDCSDVLCPSRKVCNGRGACVFPDQLSSCAGRADGMACSYIGDSEIAGTCVMNECIELRCGNGLLTPNEVCDDGNTDNGDGCSADCRSDEMCGNGIVDVEVGEQCDDGNAVDDDGCRGTAAGTAACTIPICGDAIIDPDEQCDDGAANSSTAPNTCRPMTCALPACGDNVRDDLVGEVCDDGDTLNGVPGQLEGCSATCDSDETCGNGVVDQHMGEECDDGNTIDADGCQGDCQEPFCGDGIKDPLEECDFNDFGNATCPDPNDDGLSCYMSFMLPENERCKLDRSKCQLI
jgi:cysteine-rich repeat protein